MLAEASQTPCHTEVSGAYWGWGCRQGDKITREQNARIAALKEDNYEEYLKLAANTKNQRLRTLLEKTGSIISELGLKVGTTPPQPCLPHYRKADLLDKSRHCCLRTACGVLLRVLHVARFSMLEKPSCGHVFCCCECCMLLVAACLKSLRLAVHALLP